MYFSDYVFLAIAAVVAIIGFLFPIWFYCSVSGAGWRLDHLIFSVFVGVVLAFFLVTLLSALVCCIERCVKRRGFRW